MMSQPNISTLPISNEPVALMCFVAFCCICVLTQMLGVPVTLLGLLNSDVAMESAAGSEDLSILPSTPQPEKLTLYRLFTELHPVLHLPLLLTSVFRPPLP
jgi:hypothetical protein